MLTNPVSLTRKWLLAGTVLTGALFGLAPAHAQEVAPVPADEPAADEPTEIVITGSRIRSKEYTSASPVTIITAEKSSAAGLMSASEILQSSTAAASSGQINNTFTGYVVGGGAGISTISLRGLGAQRSLVLLNGRRMPPAGVGGTVGPVDLNTIPNSFVARYEILKDGASSIYGSDAVAGVVNVITRSNFEGLQVDGSTNITEQGGGESYTLSGIWGKSFDQGHLSVALEGYEQKALVAGDRDAFACPTDNYYINGQRADAIDPTTGKYKCYTHGVEGYVGTYGPIEAFGGLAFYGSRAITPGATTDGVPGWAFIPYERRSFSDPRGMSATILSPVKRASLFVQGEYRPAGLGGAELYTEIMATKRESEQVGWAQFFPYYHEQSTANPFRVGTAPVRSFIPSWPNNATLAQLGYPGLIANPIVLYRVAADQDVSTYRVLGGVRGDWGNWSYDAYVSHSKSTGDYSTTAIIKDRVDYGTGTNQLDISLMPGGVCGTGAPAGCVPLNLFTKETLEDGVFSQAILDYYFTTDRGSTEYTQTIVEGSITGDLFTLPAGPVGSAFGISLRKDEINDVPGPLSRTQNIWGRTTAGITAGEDTLKEVYAELEVPLIQNVTPFVKDLKLNVSARYSDYDSVGSDTTYKVGLNWAVDDRFRIRATHGTSFRAPALYELYLKDQSGFLSQASVDPCINWGATGEGGQPVKSQQVRENCAADGIDPDFSGGSSSAEIFTGGGLDLKPETSQATTFGFVLTPPETGFKLAVDFWKIKVEEQISASGSAVVGACYSAFDFPTNRFCSLFERGPDGGIATIDASYRNIPSQETKGIDFTANYEKEFNLGTLSMDFEATWIKEYLSQLFPGDVVYDYQGLVGEPEWTGRLQTRFSRNDWRVTYTVNYTGPTNNVGRFGEDGVTDVFYALGASYKAWTEAWYSHDLSFQYNGKNWGVITGISNLLDEEPPVVGAGDTVSRLGNYPLSSQYYEGYLGRQFFLRLTKTF
ncbi:TonB-dependent receptor domain-containing protein [Asticcacaulis sp. AND118]|uniref:TonB-dependent receptor domain-containing protein n=1 Tax=Asticcacaulis sp. AND118 TaxID=2840468 RepID=UPI001D0008C7|nr:TonB-dependent receptor [Asticcacaulis sp. AND118]UDF05180.1 TonB-dependent receptor [Asticcacaulis sp. AND118]